MPNLIMLSSVSAALLRQQRHAHIVANEWNSFGLSGDNVFVYFLIALIIAVLAILFACWATKHIRAKTSSKRKKAVINVIIAVFVLIICGFSFRILNNHVGPAVNSHAKFSRQAQKAYENENVIDTEVGYQNDLQQAHGDKAMISRINNEIKDKKIPKGQRKMADSQIKNYTKDKQHLNKDITSDHRDLEGHHIHTVRAPRSTDIFRNL